MGKADASETTKGGEVMKTTSQTYEIRLARQSGGKAGKGRNKTSTVQVFCGSCIVRSFRFSVDDVHSLQAAWVKAREYVENRKP